jgi:GTP-binding protein
MFVDRVRIWARGGKGGDGCMSFRREKYIPLGGPDGGDGGRGGNVIIEVDPQLNNLVHIKYKPHNYALGGSHGRGAQKTGKSAKNLVIGVPPGTVIFELPVTDETFERAIDPSLGQQVSDLTEPGQKLTLAEGGRGGRGNLHFKSQNDTAPRRCEPGSRGEQRQYILELKSMADVGLVGFPNAGKSSLLAALSNAHPKIAPYPFTTLVPMIGMVDVEDYKKFTMADIPGLIEGASEGVGLGFEFLRHIERCKLLAFVIDMSGQERDPVADYRQLRKELKTYNPEMAEKPFVVIGNKMDLPDSETHLKNFRKKIRQSVISISAQDKEGLDSLKMELGKTVFSDHA